MYLAMKVNKK